MTDTPNLTAALAAVQANLPAIAKGETAVVPTKNGGKYTYSYADLADVSAVILPLLGRNGLAWVTKPTFNDAGKFVLAYKLRHISGEEEAGEYPLTVGTPQEMGSAITYARRYALCAVTGVAPAADDDDGAAATHRAQRERFEDARPARPDPDAVRQNILANARTAIAEARPEGLRPVQQRVNHLAGRGVIRQSDAEELRLLIDARRAELEPFEDRTAEPADVQTVGVGSLPGEQEPMNADWPEPARPGGGDPA